MFLSRDGAEIADLQIKSRLDLPIGVVGDAIPPGLGDALQPRRDIDAVSHQIAVALLDHVAEVDAEAKFDPTLSESRLRRCARPSPFWISMAKFTASTTLRNSTIAPSPVRLTTRP